MLELSDREVVRICGRAGPVGGHLLWRWLPPFGWMGVIYFLSTDHLSAPELRRTWTGFFAAKGAHFLEYAVLSLLWYRAIHGVLRPWNLRAAILGFVAASTYAVLDEVHQSFTVYRSGNARDIFLDSVGAFIAMTVLWAMPRWKGRGAWNPISENPRPGRESRRPPPDRDHL